MQDRQAIPPRSKQPIDTSSIAVDVAIELRRLLSDDGAVDALRAMLDLEDQLLSFEDVKRLTGIADDALRKLIKVRAVPMWKAGREWRITRKQYREAASRGFAVPEGRVMTKRKR